MKIFFTILFVYVCLVVQVASLTYFCDHSAPCGCSRNDAILNKIVGGEEAISSSWGWAVSLRDDGDNHICGGAIISPKYVVTAAHCVSDQNSLSTGMSVAVGMNRLSESDTVGQVRKVAEIIQHPRYDDSTHTNDIAVLRLNSSLDLSISASIVRLCLPRINVTSDIGKYPPDSTPLIAIGWGTLFFGSQNLPNQLQQVTVNEVPTNDFTCSIYNSQLQFCAGVNGGGKGNLFLKLLET
ncbi:unnamed protein product [Rotaria sp. Silwood2]|nr:unnamed protein product [Rotaria sp. Silwood2]CAF2813491.1 unnamed protein product [Rotaria sp. Silwood2]CAF2962659.1 unnamed protein product [Rotaria sp. Silwood2]CAF3104576.1 unnamed protein product [Rotaria sp. Silwood2]CAF3887718.1 unnamed protein product [Rotaria sp. Silwood2]